MLLIILIFYNKLRDVDKAKIGYEFINDRTTVIYNLQQIL